MATNSSSFDHVYQWVKKQQIGCPILPSLAVHDLREAVSPVDVATAIAAMSSKGMLRRVFAVRTPSGTILRKTYDSASQIDPVVYDQYNRPIDEDELDLVPAFVRVDK